MSVTGQTKEGIGFLEEETGEFFKNQKMANDGRTLRNEGRIADGKAPKLTEPGTGHFEKDEHKSDKK